MRLRTPHTHPTIAVTWMDNGACRTAHHASPIAAEVFVVGLGAKGVTPDRCITWDGAEIPDQCGCEGRAA